jgi:hypothetical protein
MVCLFQDKILKSKCTGTGYIQLFSFEVSRASCIGLVLAEVHSRFVSTFPATINNHPPNPDPSSGKPKHRWEPLESWMQYVNRSAVKSGRQEHSQSTAVPLESNGMIHILPVTAPSLLMMSKCTTILYLRAELLPSLFEKIQRSFQTPKYPIKNGDRVSPIRPKRRPAPSPYLSIWNQRRCDNYSSWGLACSRSCWHGLDSRWTYNRRSWGSCFCEERWYVWRFAYRRSACQGSPYAGIIKSLMLASPVFRTMLGNDTFQEGRELLSKGKVCISRSSSFLMAMDLLFCILLQIPTLYST